MMYMPYIIVHVPFSRWICIAVLLPFFTRFVSLTFYHSNFCSHKPLLFSFGISALLFYYLFFNIASVILSLKELIIMSVYLIAGLYIGVALLKLLKNSLHEHFCAKLYVEYRLNYQTSPQKNHFLTSQVRRHFKRTDTYCKANHSQHYLSNRSSYVFSDVEECFYYALGIYKDRKRRAFLWLYDDVLSKLSVILIPQRLKENPVIALLFGLLQCFVIYLAELALDTSGIGNKILDYLYATLTELWRSFQAFPH